MSENILAQINSPAELKKLPIEKLPQLANEIRHKIIEITFKNGGHLGSNLGVIELTIALHYIFNLEYDRVIWDVSHQCYTHKILTGRKDRF
ncbi:MAG: 1-deoxy-D-xylulose-5-phosphate synthase N-terminal domain-containing protein [Planctomycetota bacterium]